MTDKEVEGVKRRRVRYKKRYPEKTKAHKSLAYAVKVGKVKRSPFCELCLGTDYICGHHKDYLKRLDVIWLCRICHNWVHGNFKKIDQSNRIS